MDTARTVVLSLAGSVLIAACVAEDATPGGVMSRVDAGGASSSSSSAGSSGAGGSSSGNPIVDAAVEAAIMADAGMDAALPTTTCVQQALDGANIRCSAAGPGPLSGGSISTGKFIINRSKGPTCIAYIYGAATIYQEGTNLFMRWLRIENKTTASDPGVQRYGTALLRPGAGNMFERIEVCDPSTLGKRETGTFGVEGTGDVSFDFTTYSEGWQKVP